MDSRILFFLSFFLPYDKLRDSNDLIWLKEISFEAMTSQRALRQVLEGILLSHKANSRRSVQLFQFPPHYHLSHLTDKTEMTPRENRGWLGTQTAAGGTNTMA